MLPQICFVPGGEVASLIILSGHLADLAALVALVVLVAAASCFVD